LGGALGVRKSGFCQAGGARGFPSQGCGQTVPHGGWDKPLDQLIIHAHESLSASGITLPRAAAEKLPVDPP
jgi:hypothetical protein